MTNDEKVMLRLAREGRINRTPIPKPLTKRQAEKVLRKWKKSAE